MSKRTMDIETATRFLGPAEQQLAHPVIPGELRAWSERARAALEFVSEQWEEERVERQGLLEDIERQDNELCQRVRRLRERQQSLDEELGALLGRLDALLEARVGPDGSWEPVERAERVREQGLKWIVRARAFGVELTVWLLEAYLRDRGKVD